VNTLRAALSIFRTQGFGGLLRRVGERLSGTTGRAPSPVRREDVLAVDWSVPHPAVTHPRTAKSGPLTVAWIMSRPGEASGGHQNIYRFIHYMEQAGHHVRIYLYNVERGISIAQVKNMVRRSSSYPDLAADVAFYPEGGVPSDTDAIVATGWETAYAAFRDPSLARRFYFVQDFEPYFYPVGTDSVLAENTYRFGFTGLTAGGWLAQKLSSEYGMETSAYEFGADPSNYSIVNDGPRREVFFYARPGTERRGFELGIMALELFSAAHPEYLINLAGWDVSRYKIPFAYRNLKTMPVGQLNEVYNRCAAGLVLSMTNMSLLPLELLAAGVIPAVNDGENNTMVSDNPFIEYTPASPKALADRLAAIVERTDLPDYARKAAASVADADWAKSGEQFLRSFERAMRS